jgi:hypothetical protein
MMTLDMYPIPGSDVIGSILKGRGAQPSEAVLVLPAKGQVKVLNDVGARIWTLSDGTRTVREIVALITAEYQVDPSTAETDTLEFLSDLVEREIVRLSDHPKE